MDINTNNKVNISYELTPYFNI